MEPLIFSVITPSLNSFRYFDKALSSLFAQEGDFYIQSIVMDGGSSDGTVEFLAESEQLLKKSSVEVRCRGIELDWASQKDSGQSEALNSALDKVHGDIVVWLNADDWFEPNAFQKVTEVFAEKTSLEIVLGDCRQMVSETEPLVGARTSSYVNDVSQVSPFTGGIQWGVVTPEVFFRRHCIEAFRFDLSLEYFMDVDLWMHLFLRQPVWQKIDQTFASFRWHDACKTLKAWNRFLPRLLVEDMVLYARYASQLDTQKSENAFIKLMQHFIDNWHRLGVFHENDASLLQSVKEYTALSEQDKGRFCELYSLALAQYTTRKES